jgi:hypothetical protein
VTDRKVTTHQRRRAAKQEAKFARMLTVIATLNNPERLAELVARLEQPSEPDGYPTTSGQAGSPSADQSSSVERAVEARDSRTTTDPVRRAGESFLRNVARAEKSLIEALRQSDVIMNSSVVKGRVNSIPQCQACERDVLPADGGLRGGLCNACRMAWVRLGESTPLGQRDRPSFERERRQARAEQEASALDVPSRV